MKTIFDISSNRQALHPYYLLVEIGPGNLSLAFYDKATQAIDKIQYYEYNEMDAEEQLTQIFSEMKSTNFERTVFSSSFPQALLTPYKYFKNNFSSLDVIYEATGQHYLHNEIPEWQIVIQYAMPQKIYDLINENFVSPQFLHSYVPAIKIYNGSLADEQIRIDFTSGSFRVVVKKAEQILLVQTYKYTSPADVLYYLIKICSEFDMKQSSVHLILSGFVEKDSSLFTELQNYFLHLHFAQAPECKLPQMEHPQYYFSSLYNLAACAL